VWLYVPSTASPSARESEASSLASTSPSPGTERSLTLRGKHMPLRFWQRAWKRVPWLKHLFGTTWPHSTAQRGVDEWISSLPVSRVNPSPSPASGSESKTSAGSGPSSPASSPTCDHERCFLRTRPDLFGSACITSSATLPRSGSMRSGVCSERPTLAPRTVDRASSFWPTISAERYGTNQGGAAGRVGPVRPSLDTLAKTWSTPTAGSSSGRQGRTGTGAQSRQKLNPRFVEMLQGFPQGWTAFERSGIPFSRFRELWRSALSRLD